MDEHLRDRTADSGHAAGLTGPVSARAAAAALGVNERTIRRAIARGDLPAAKRAGAYLITPADLARYRERLRLPPRSAVRAVIHAPRLIPLPKRLRETAPVLPAPLTALIGREPELKAVADLFQRDNVRLVTLTGPGGVGKTRLSLQVAANLAGAFDAGVRFVPLAAVPNSSLVATSVASALDLRERGGHSLSDMLFTALRERDTLLLLDNFEHLLAATNLLTDLLEHCPKLRILVTSRTLLRVAGEHAFPVSPLSLPDPDAGSTPEALAADAITLFAERARAVVPNFALSDTTAPLVVDICRRLDGLPLAIELAAARLTHLPLASLRERLERRLPLLTRGGGRSDRHHTLRNAISWSYDLLNADEKTFFRRLAVFPGGVTLEAAEAVYREVDPTSSSSVLDSIATLIDASLLQQEIDPDGTARYRMLETIREFAGERFAESDEKEEVCRAHAAHVQSFANRYELAELLPNSDEAIARLDAEAANLRSALAWLEEADESEQFLQLAATLGRYWYGQGHFREGRNWLERALEQSERPHAADRAKALVLLGVIDGYLGADSAKGRLIEGLSACRDASDPLHAFYALIFLATFAITEGDLDHAASLLAEAHANALVVADQRLASILLGLSLINRAVLDRIQGNGELAVTRLQDALHLLRDVGHNPGIILVLSDLGDVARDDGDYPQAFRHYQDALSQIRESTGTRVIIDTIESVATVASAVGLADHSARLMGACEALRDRIGYRFRGENHQLACEQALATIRAALGQPAFATIWASGRALSVEQAVSEAFTPFALPAERPRTLLTPREAEILPLLAAGQTDREIGIALYLSYRTVGNHVARIMSKLGVHTRAAAIDAARQRGLLPGTH